MVAVEGVTLLEIGIIGRPRSSKKSIIIEQGIERGHDGEYRRRVHSSIFRKAPSSYSPPIHVSAPGGLGIVEWELLTCSELISPPN